MVGKAVSVLVPASCRRRHTAGFRAAWSTGVFEPSGTVMIRVVCADGETRSFASHIFPIRNPRGEVGVRYARTHQEARPRGVLISSSTANWY